ncbi:MAG: glycosyltransferase [Clostridiaceae bacterium]
MKILLATDTFYPMINGVVTSTTTLYKELIALGQDVRILTLSEDGNERFENNIYYLKSIKINIYPDARLSLRSNSELINQIEIWKPDIIHTQTEFSIMMIARKISNKIGIPLIHTYHTMYEDYTNFLIKSKRINKKLVSQIIKQMLGRFSAVIAPTDKTAKTLIEYNITAPIYTIPTGLELSKFSKMVEEEEYINNKKKYNLINHKTLVYLGRVSEEKNIEELISYINNNKEYFNDKNFLIVGGGPNLKKLIALVDKYEINSIVKFTGMVEPDEVYKYYKLGDIFITASTTETQGLTYIEAMASGLPVVCRKDESVEELILNYDNGFKYENEEEFFKTIKNIFEDNKLYEQMCIKSLDKAKEYSSTIFGQSVLKVYQSTVDGYKYIESQDLEDDYNFISLLNEILPISDIKDNITSYLGDSKDKIVFRVKKLKDGSIEVNQSLKNRITRVSKKIKIRKRN